MSYRRDRSKCHLEQWLREHKHVLLEMGVPEAVLADPATFGHDFLDHGYDIPSNLSRSGYQAMLSFLTEQFGAEVFHFGVAMELARLVGVNAELRTQEGVCEEAGQLWFRTGHGATPAYILGADGCLQRVCLYLPEQAWVGLPYWQTSWSQDEWLSSGVVESVGLLAPG